MINFTKEKSLHACHLTKDNLSLLIGIIKTDFPNSNRIEDFKINTHTEEIDISENELETFLEHGRLPGVLTKLSISLIGWSDDSEIDKSITLSLRDTYSILRVSGASESWVNGKFIQITNFLKESRPVLWFLYTPLIYYIRGAILPFLIGGIYIIGKKIFIGDIASIGIILPIGLVSLVALDSVVSKMKHTKVFIKEQQSFSDKYKDALSLIAIIGVIFTIIGVIISLIK